MKKFVLCFLANALLFLGFSTPALGDAQIDIGAQVTTVFVGINVTAPSPIDYGVLQTSQISGVQGPIVIENRGTVNEDFFLHGEDATNGLGGSTWHLASGPGNDFYRHGWAHDPFVWPGDFHPLTYEYVNSQIATGVAPTGTDVVKTILHMPTQSSGTGTYTTKIWVRATATP